MRLLPLALAALLLSGCSDPSEDGDDGANGPADDATTSGPGGMSGSATGTSSGAAAAPRTHEVVMADNLFDPDELQVAVGDTVRWTTQDVQAHNIVSDSEAAAFRSPDVSPLPVHEQEFSYTFEAAGTVEYVCEYHPGMTGTIVVS